MPRLPSGDTVLKRLRNPYGSYLNRYDHRDRPLLFEKLTVQAIASILHLPFADLEHEDRQAPHRVTWLGNARRRSRAPGGGPDGIAQAHGFLISIEATLKNGSGQWAREFAQALRHARGVSERLALDLSHCYIALVVRALHVDTFSAVRASNQRSPLKIIPLELSTLAALLETALLAFTTRHVEVACIFDALLDSVSNSHDLPQFRTRSVYEVEEWQKHVLDLEKGTVIGIKSYEAMVGEGLNHVGVSDILLRLNKNQTVNRYFEKIAARIDGALVCSALLQESLGVQVGKIPGGEELFAPVPLDDFRSRCRRRLSAVEAISAE